MGFGKKRDHYGTKPRFRALLRMEMQDGGMVDVVTGPEWKASDSEMVTVSPSQGDAVTITVTYNVVALP